MADGKWKMAQWGRNDAEYWLKLIGSFGGESPVIVVLNRIRQHPFDLNYRALQGRVPSLSEHRKRVLRERRKNYLGRLTPGRGEYSVEASTH